ncbi:MAG: thioredoxin [Gemmatimonadales bacterium]|nr:MAG: thioredoxin [Gemmatimonadales bacterium]
MTPAPPPPSGGAVPHEPEAVVSDEHFRRRVRESTTPLLVDFHATWCGPCKWLEPILEQVAREAGERVAILKVDVDLAPETAEAFRIASVPTVVLLREGREVERSLGVEPQRVRAMAGLSADGGEG